MFKSLLMSKIEILVPETEVISATELLANSGIFHLDQQKAADVSSGTVNWQSRISKLSTVERRVLFVMQELGIDAGPVPDVQPHMIDPDIALRDIANLEREVEEPVKALGKLNQRYTELNTYLDQLTNLKDLNVRLCDLYAMRYVYAISGMMPTENIERLENSLEHLPYILVQLHQAKGMSTVMLFAQQGNADRLLRATRSAYLKPIQPLADYKGTPAETILAIQAGLKRIQTHIDEYTLEVKRLHEARDEHLRYLLWRVRASRKLSEVIAGYDHFHKLYNIQGWVPTRDLESLQKKIHLLNEHIEIETKPIAPGDDLPIPTEMDNKGIVRAFQFLISNYGQPGYNELNPAIILALTFPLIFGVMFGDVGHGLLLVIAGAILALGVFKNAKNLAPMGIVVLACGLGSMLFGFLYGSIFGYENVLTPLWIQPLDNINSILLATVYAGTALLTIGMVYNIINAVMKRQWGAALFGHNSVTGLVFYWSLIGLVASSFGIAPVPSSILTLLAVLAGLCLTFGEPLSNLVDHHKPLIEDGIGMYIVKAFFELYEAIITMLSNTLSYVRMGAFAVAHGALSMVIFILAEMLSPDGGIGYVVVVILGNLFVIGFEGLIVTIQTLRLEYYEFFSKFFMGRGVAFQPLNLLKETTTE